VPGQRVAGVVGGAQDLDVEPLEKGSRAELGPGQLVAQLLVDRLGVGPGQRLRDAEDLVQLVGQPDAGRGAQEQVEVVGEDLPDLPVVDRSAGSTGPPRRGTPSASSGTPWDWSMRKT